MRIKLGVAPGARGGSVGVFPELPAWRLPELQGAGRAGPGHIWFRSHLLWIITQFSFVVRFVCLLFKNSHFLCPRVSKHPRALPFPDGKSSEGVPLPLACPHFPHLPPQAYALGSLTMGLILEYFLFSRAESTWEYFSWWECSHLKDLLF